MIPFALAAILAAAPARGSADGGVKVAPVSPKYPLLIDADHAHIEGKKQEAQWRGHVKVTRGPTNIFCNRLVAYYTEQQEVRRGPLYGEGKGGYQDKWATGGHRCVYYNTLIIVAV